MASDGSSTPASSGLPSPSPGRFRPRGSRPTLAGNLTKEEIAEGCRLLRLGAAPARPRTRADCVDGERPCPWVGCKWHLALDVLETGNLKVNFNLEQLEQLEDTCALDVADRGGCTLDEVGQRINVTRERIRQIEAKMLVKLYRRFKALGIDNAEGFLHIRHALAVAQEEEGTKTGGFRTVSDAAGDFNRAERVRRAAAAVKMEKGRARRVRELGPKVGPRRVSDQAKRIRDIKAAQTSEMREELTMRASKMDKLEGAAALAVRKSLVDTGITVGALYEQLEELGAVEEHELTESGIGYYLRTRRAAIARGDMDEPEVEESAELVKAPESPQGLPEPKGYQVPMTGAIAPADGYVVLPGGEIWTGSAERAMELQQRIIAGRSKGG